MSLILCLTLELFLLLGCLVQPQSDEFYLIIVYFVMFCHFLLGACSLLTRDRKGVDSKGREQRRGELEGVKGRETVIRIYYCMRRDSIF